MLYLIKTFFSKKTIFKPIRPKKIIFLDDGFICFKKNINNSFTLNRENIYFFILLKSLINKVFSNNNNRLYDIYFKNLINKLNPKIAISHEIDHRIFKIKKINPKTKILVYQHNSLLDYETQISQIKCVKNKSCDFFFVFDEYSKNLYRKYVNSNFILAGSLKNNEYKYTNESHKYDIMFVSEFRSHKMKIQTLCQKKILLILNDYAKQKGVKICVALNSIRKEKKNINYEEEKNFIKKNAPLIDIVKEPGYLLAAKSKLTIFLSSNLGAEILSTKKRVLGLFIKAKYRKKWKSPYMNKKTKIFFTYSKNKKEIFKKIDFLLKIKNKKWKKILNKSQISFKYDYKNKIFLNMLKKISLTA